MACLHPVLLISKWATPHPGSFRIYLISMGKELSISDTSEEEDDPSKIDVSRDASVRAVRIGDGRAGFASTLLHMVGQSRYFVTVGSRSAVVALSAESVWGKRLSGCFALIVT